MSMPISVPQPAPIATMHADPYKHDSVRKGALHYLLGRGTAGAAGLFIVLLLVRFMDIGNYAAFTALSGLIAACGILAGLGMERVVSRYVPEGRLHRSADDLRRFIWKISAVRLLACLVVVAALYALWWPISRFLGLEQYGTFAPCIGFFIVGETMFQHFSSVLQALVMQKILTRLLVIQWGGRLLILAAALLVRPNLDWEETFWIFAVPELLGVLAFAWVLRKHLSDIDAARGGTFSGSAGRESADGERWPEWGRVSAVGMHNFGFTLLAAPPQGYFMKMLTAAYLPIEIVAAYGFFISVAEKIRQYIPMYFFYGLLEPVMIASYLKDRNFAALSERCQVLYKTNLLLMALAVAISAAAGDAGLAIATGGKFQGLSWILPLVLVQLTIGSHVVVLQLLLNSLEQSKTLIMASTFALPIMLIAMALVVHVHPVWLLFTPLLFSFCMNFYIVYKLAQGNHPYKPDWRMLLSIFFAALIAYVPGRTLASVLIPSMNSVLVLGCVCIVVTVVYAMALFLLSVINRAELAWVKAAVLNKQT